MWSSLGPETHSFFQPDFLVYIILLIGRDVKGNLRPYGGFLWKIGLVLTRDSLVVSEEFGALLDASGWRGGCASRMKTEKTGSGGMGTWTVQLVFLERECVRLFLMI